MKTHVSLNGSPAAGDAALKPSCVRYGAWKGMRKASNPRAVEKGWELGLRNWETRSCVEDGMIGYVPGVSITRRWRPSERVVSWSSQVEVTADDEARDLKTRLPSTEFPVALLPLPVRPTSTRVVGNFAASFTSASPPSQFVSSSTNSNSSKSDPPMASPVASIAIKSPPSQPPTTNSPAITPNHVPSASKSSTKRRPNSTHRNSNKGQKKAKKQNKQTAAPN
jgi:hypothetical protein